MSMTRGSQVACKRLHVLDADSIFAGRSWQLSVDSNRVKMTTLSVQRCAFVGDWNRNIIFSRGTQGRLQNCTLSADLCTSLSVQDNDDFNCSPNRTLPVYVDESSRTPLGQPSLGVPLTADDSFPPLAAAPDVFAGANDTALVAIQQVCCRFCVLDLRLCSNGLCLSKHMGCPLQSHLCL